MQISFIFSHKVKMNLCESAEVTRSAELFQRAYPDVDQPITRVNVIHD